MATFRLIDRAIGFAARAHDGQARKIGEMPYIAHPVAVAMLLQRLGEEDSLVAAALLHDTVEDAGVTLAEIRDEFGDTVADIVAGCTEIRGSWEARKGEMIDRLHDAPLPVKVVVAADKYHNLLHVNRQRGKEGPAVWSHFSRGYEQQRSYYQSVLESLLANVDEPQEHPIFAMLAEMVNQVFRPDQPGPPGLDRSV